MKPGDVVTINCTSAKSKPVTTLEWYINDQIIESRVSSNHRENG